MPLLETADASLTRIARRGASAPWAEIILISTSKKYAI
jgi:hypothetical protein